MKNLLLLIEYPQNFLDKHIKNRRFKIKNEEKNQNRTAKNDNDEDKEII